MRLSEFFEDEAGFLSMSRLMMFGSFIVVSYIMVWTLLHDKMNETYFSAYLVAYGANYLIGKGIDSKSTRAS